MSLACITDLKKTKKAANGRFKWRFTVLVDALGETLGSPGWLYLPHAKEGWRVYPPSRGNIKLMTGVKQPLTQRLERLVEEKLARGVDNDEPDVQEYQQAVLKGDL